MTPVGSSYPLNGFPVLEYVGSFELQGCGFTTVESPIPANDDVLVYQNEYLTSIPGLGQIEALTGNFIVQANPALVDVRNLSLRNVGGNVFVQGNSKLRQCYVDAAFSGVAAAGTRAIDGNLGICLGIGDCPSGQIVAAPV